MRQNAESRSDAQSAIDATHPSPSNRGLVIHRLKRFVRRQLRHPPVVMLPIVGAAALLWYLFRVGPKPSRAGYPCQRAAAPMAASFLAWLGALATYHGARELWRRTRNRALLTIALPALLLGTVALLVVVWPWMDAPASADGAEPHGVLGVGKGIHPGRVVWVHAPDATEWEGPDSSERWYSATCTDQAIVDRMVSTAIQRLTGCTTDAQAWESLLLHFNATHGREHRGYRAGERVGIKLNLVTCWAAYKNSTPWVDLATREKTRYPNHVDVAPQMVRALLHQLVNVVGVAESDIAVGDTTAIWPNAYYDPLHAEFPAVQFVDNVGGMGRTRAEFSSQRISWSTPGAAGKTVDYVPTMFADADYVINFAVLKGHSSGITVCGKNLYGALIRLPNGHLHYDGRLPYYDLHLSLPNREYTPGKGHYRAMVDAMGHPDLGGKTVLYLVDGLYGGYYSESRPQPWKSPPFGDGTIGDWPSSLFVSQDPVAIDSVAHDFLLNEWPVVVTGGVHEAGSLQGGQEDYLHEAALASSPASGTIYDPDADGLPLFSLGVHEHWNNPTDRKYSRNLGMDEGIELVAERLWPPIEPTAARIASFQASRSEGGVEIVWHVLVEIGTIGYFVERSSGLEWLKVTSEIVPAQGTGGFPVTYRLREENASLPLRTLYRLVEVQLDGGERVLAQTTAQDPTALRIQRRGRECLVTVTGIDPTQHGQPRFEVANDLATGLWRTMEDTEVLRHEQGWRLPIHEGPGSIGAFLLRARLDRAQPRTASPTQ